MSALDPLETLYDAPRALTSRCRRRSHRSMARSRSPCNPGRPCVIGNFVTTLDGVVSLNVPANPVAARSVGSDQHDRMVMGLLRAVADVVIVGAGTLR